MGFEMAFRMLLLIVLEPISKELYCQNVLFIEVRFMLVLLLPKEKLL